MERRDLASAHELLLGAHFWPAVVNDLLELLPSVVMAPKQTVMINASITAYSTAVGPLSSRIRSCTNCRKAASMVSSLLKKLAVVGSSTGKQRRRLVGGV
jgi:hypothetical protein